MPKAITSVSSIFYANGPPRWKIFWQTAPKWDQIRQQWFGNTFHLEAMLALLNPAWTVGDLGTGTGSMLALVAPHVKKVIGVEPLAAMLKAAKTRVKDEQLANVEVVRGTLEDLPLENASLDVCLRYAGDAPCS